MASKSLTKAGDKGTAEAGSVRLCCSSVAALLQLCCSSVDPPQRQRLRSTQPARAQVKRKQSSSKATTYEAFIVVKSLTKKTTKAAHRQRLRNTHSARKCSLPTPHLSVLFWVSICTFVLARGASTNTDYRVLFWVNICTFVRIPTPQLRVLFWVSICTFVLALIEGIEPNRASEIEGQINTDIAYVEYIYIIYIYIYIYII
jgi:hypothetical protein